MHVSSALSIGQRVLAPREILVPSVIVRIDSGMVAAGGEVVYWVREVEPNGLLSPANPLPFRASQLQVVEVPR